MNTIEHIKDQFSQIHPLVKTETLSAIERNAFDAFSKMGIPTVRHEEWKYTRISSVFNTSLEFKKQHSLSSSDLDDIRLPGYETANEIVFVNGFYSSPLSTIRTESLVVLPFNEAIENGFGKIISQHLGHSSRYNKDGIHALNTAFLHDGLFIHLKNGLISEHPVYVYHITDARQTNVLSQPRSLIYVGENAQLDLVETYATLGLSESFTNQVMEMVVEQGALVSWYKIQNDATHTSQVNTSLIRQVGKSVVYVVTISLDGGIVRNNLNIALEKEYSEAHLTGLYFAKGNSHIDNHTVVDHIKPNCESNELYKGIMDDNSTAVFNGKIFVQPDAQKTNAFQSNKNVLLSETASVNTKPQLEIFADDVKCSHGCTVGQLDDEGLFYLRSRGINEAMARSLLVHAFVIDILDHVKLKPIRDYIDQMINQRLDFPETEL